MFGYVLAMFPVNILKSFCRCYSYIASLPLLITPFTLSDSYVSKTMIATLAVSNNWVVHWVIEANASIGGQILPSHVLRFTKTTYTHPVSLDQSLFGKPTVGLNAWRTIYKPTCSSMLSSTHYCRCGPVNNQTFFNCAVNGLIIPACVTSKTTVNEQYQTHWYNASFFLFAFCW